jgi:hypothetical protein
MDITLRILPKRRLTHATPFNTLRKACPLWLLLATAVTAAGQTPAPSTAGDAGPLNEILRRLTRLEEQNRELLDEVHQLRSALAQSRGAPETASAQEPAPLQAIEEKLEVQERRIEEQAQTKVESSQHLPVRITGLALFTASLNSRQTGGFSEEITAPPRGGALSGGATLRQSIVGFEFRGPETIWGGKIHGALNMDFNGGSGEPYDSLLRIRTAALQVDWKNTSVMFGQDKPLLAPREPTSIVQVAVPALSGAGNLWLWQPQAQVEQRFHLDPQTTVRAQLGVYQTREDYYAPVASFYGSSLQDARPGLQGRFGFSHRLDDERRLEFAGGFHTSTTHVLEYAVPSRVFALDWFANPWRKLEFSGAFFRGHNLTNLGGIGQGFTVERSGYVIPVHAEGGWAQFSFLLAPRLTLNIFGGQQDNRNRDIRYGVAKNQSYAANLMYRMAPNVIVSFEGGQLRTTFLSTGNRLNNRYDLGFAYLF